MSPSPTSAPPSPASRPAPARERAHTATKRIEHSRAPERLRAVRSHLAAFLVVVGAFACLATSSPAPPPPLPPDELPLQAAEQMSCPREALSERRPTDAEIAALKPAQRGVRETVVEGCGRRRLYAQQCDEHGAACRWVFTARPSLSRP